MLKISSKTAEICKYSKQEIFFFSLFVGITRRNNTVLPSSEGLFKQRSRKKGEETLSPIRCYIFDGRPSLIHIYNFFFLHSFVQRCAALHLVFHIQFYIGNKTSFFDRVQRKIQAVRCACVPCAFRSVILKKKREGFKHRQRNFFGYKKNGKYL